MIEKKTFYHEPRGKGNETGEDILDPSRPKRLPSLNMGPAKTDAAFSCQS